MRDIGCRNEHMFCKGCLDKYFQNEMVRKSCPICKEEGLSKQTIKVPQFASRAMNVLKIKCELRCGWRGTLGDLHQHKIKDCPLQGVYAATALRAAAYSELITERLGPAANMMIVNFHMLQLRLV